MPCAAFAEQAFNRPTAWPHSVPGMFRQRGQQLVCRAETTSAWAILLSVIDTDSIRLTSSEQSRGSKMQHGILCHTMLAADICAVCICRGHFNLGHLTPGEMADLWLDIGVPKKTGSEKKGSERKRDKILGFFMGAKGNQQKDVEGCRAHIQVWC